MFINSISMAVGTELGGIGSLVGTAMLNSIPYRDAAVSNTMKYLVPGFLILGLSFCLMFLAPVWLPVSMVIWVNKASIAFVTILWVFGLRRLHGRVSPLATGYGIAVFLAAAILLTRAANLPLAYIATPVLLLALGVYALADHWHLIRGMRPSLAAVSLAVYITYIFMWVVEIYALLLQRPHWDAALPNPGILHLAQPYGSILAVCYGLLPLTVTAYLTLLINNGLVFRLRRQAFTDTLTGAKSRLALDELSAPFLAGARRLGLTIGVIILDIDHFKSINDLHGHLAGDKVLQELSAILAKTSRADDLLIRYGGEEFLLLCRMRLTDHELGLAERLRLAVRAHGFSWKHSHLCLTVSAGMVLLRENEALESAINRADELLYQAKFAGRNQVAVDHTP
ncbi:MAG: GGDEF domain-containing protein [Acidocella sp.]|nr:GGDEF domain-containing protein [Acidocella sp.]